MARPKTLFSQELAAKAQADLKLLDQHGIIQKLRAIVSASSHPTAIIAEVLGVSVETIWRWAKAYEKNGVEGLYPKTRRAKPSKLDSSQKAMVLTWIDECRTQDGKAVHWTLERLRQAILDQFNVTLGINTIWVWLRNENRRLKVPRPRHYKGDEEAQQAFKKNT
jgi:transposase